MADLDIINQLGSKLGINLKETQKDLYFYNGYSKNKSGKITALNLNKCEIKNLELIVPFLKELKSLKQLYLSENMIIDVSPLKTLNKLKYLDLSNNQIIETHDIEYLMQNNKLSFLNIFSNSIEILTENIFLFYSLNHSKAEYARELKNRFVKEQQFEEAAYLREIERKYLGEINGQISKKDLEFLMEKILEALYKSNPIKSPSIEIIKQGNDAILRFFEKIKTQGVDYIYEAKLTLVGEGNAGKTSLQRRILNEKAELPQSEKRTRGIEIKDWLFKEEKGIKYIAHIWDFGGQDVYYPVHRFFITENSVFVLLASTRQTQHNFDYWIPTIFQFGSKSPIIIGQTCHEGNKILWNDLGEYIGNSNFNIIKTGDLPYIEINLINNNEGLKAIKETIISQIYKLPRFGKGVISSWVPIRFQIAEKAKTAACISFESFASICIKANPENFTDLIYVKDFCQFLHDIGVVLWYSDNEYLRNWVILQPEWAMNAVYKIIDDDEIQSRRGNILANDFIRLWQDRLYIDKFEILKKMLEVFKIAFPKKHCREDYILPARLLSLPNELKWRDTDSYLRLEYGYEFMPRGLVNQLSAELSRYINTDEEVWNNAVNFASKKNTAQCQVIEDFYNRKISIKAKGKDARGLITLVMDSLNEITAGYKGVKSEIYVPCTCHKCKNNNRPTIFLYDKLLDWSTNRKNAVVVCNESGEGLSIDELLFNIGLSTSIKQAGYKKRFKKNPLKIFVSYSKHDENYLQDFQDHLITMKDEGLVSFDCREIDFGEEWDTVIKNKIEESDIIVCLVSVKFLNTDYITRIEIPKAIEQNKIIIPIIIKACDWEKSALGKYQAAQRGKVVSLNNNQKLMDKIKGHSEEEKAAFWTAIIKEFRKKLFD